MHRFSDAARDDLLDIWVRLHDDAGERVADRQINAITERFYLLARYPYLGRDRSDDLGGMRRSYIVGLFVIIYRLEENDVLIMRVIDGRRDIDAMLR